MGASPTLNQLAARLDAPFDADKPPAPEQDAVDVGADAVVYSAPFLKLENTAWYSSSGDRETNMPSVAFPPDLALGTLRINSPQAQQINCTFHDFACTFWTQTAAGGLRDGCHFYNMGYNSPYGQAMYDQHVSEKDTRVYRNCIISQNFAYGLHAFGSPPLHNLRFERCIFHDSGVLVGGAGGAFDITFDECVFWNVGAAQLGYGATPNGKLTFTNCIVAFSPVWLLNWADLTMTGNVIHDDNVPLRYATDRAPEAASVNHNHYYGNEYFHTFNTGMTFDQYQKATGFDADSTFKAGTPTENAALVFPSRHAPRVATLAVCNWEGRDRVTVGVSTLGMVEGHTYVLRSAYDPLNDGDTFDYDGSGSITLDFTRRTVALPTGWRTPLATLDPRFGAWLLEAA